MPFPVISQAHQQAQGVEGGPTAECSSLANSDSQRCFWSIRSIHPIDLGGQSSIMQIDKDLNVAYTVSDDRKSLFEFLTGWVSALGVSLRAAFSSPIVDESIVADAERTIDPDFEGWLHGDPMVTKNPAGRYGDRTPGYITGNGLGSMEIGAADD